jgi:uncharacterized alkaline shock family protein YloU
MTSIAADYEKTEMGNIQIAPEVIEVIAGLATIEIKGVAGRKNLSKGVKVEVGQREAAVDVSIIIDYGFKIPEVAHEIQRNVKQAIESMTGLDVVEVNVHIHDVHFKAADKEKTEEEAALTRVKLQ